MKKLIILGVAGLVVVLVGLISPTFNSNSTLSLNQIQTDLSKTYPSSTKQDCAWFNEAVDSNKKIARAWFVEAVNNNNDIKLATANIR